MQIDAGLIQEADVLNKAMAVVDTFLAGKHMTFKLDREEYALPILKVREINGLMDITRLPKAPECIRGVINLRG